MTHRPDCEHGADHDRDPDTTAYERVVDPQPVTDQHSVKLISTDDVAPAAAAAPVGDMASMSPVERAEYVRVVESDPTTPDPMAYRESTRAALSSPAYRRAFDSVMVGAVDGLTIEETGAVRLAQTLTGTAPPGLPMPFGINGADPAVTR